MEAWQVVRQFAPHARIVHHIAGRIRLKFLEEKRLSEKMPEISPERIRQALQTIPGVRAVSFNLLARSCTLEYDPKQIPHEAFPDLIACRETPAAQWLIDVLQAKYTEFSGN